jgi:type III pantothenate kinase
MLLVIDIGNTRTKWALAGDDGNLVELEVCMNANVAASNLSVAARKADGALIANVAGETMAQQILQLLTPLQPEFIAVSKQACGVTNNNYPALGTDRWAALIAVRHRVKQAVLVVNAGTAITMDALTEKGVFLGGTIMPGLHLMHASLNQHAAQINIHAGSGDAILNNFPTNTQDATQAGCMNAVVGAICLMLKRLEKHSGWLPKLVISGGDASKIAEALKPELKQVMMMEYLVLHGLVLLAKI